MFHFLRTFLRSETGAVSVDWVVLTASVILLALGAVSLVDESMQTIGPKIGSSVAVGNGD